MGKGPEHINMGGFLSQIHYFKRECYLCHSRYIPGKSFETEHGCMS